MKQRLFITGMPRSGTTLMDTVLSMHKDIDIISQPLPPLFTQVKQEFLAYLGLPETTFPLSDQIFANYYPPKDLLLFLNEFTLSTIFLRNLGLRMVKQLGKHSKPKNPLSWHIKYNNHHLDSFVEKYLADIAEKSTVIGLKEIFCEEYIGYFLSKKWKILLIIRDPRDIITSLNSGSGQRFGGCIKPHLFNVRTWRKSVATALAFSQNKNFLFVQYENLVTKPVVEYLRITKFIELDTAPTTLILGKLMDRSGQPWHSNSSHIPTMYITAKNVGTYKNFLSNQEQMFIEAICLPELKILGYPTELDINSAPDVLRYYQDSAQLHRPELDSYRFCSKRLDEELFRLDQLQRHEFNPRLFIFLTAFQQLANSI